MSRLLHWLRQHPLVWVVPAFFFTVVLLLLAWQLAVVPKNPFVYDL